MRSDTRQRKRAPARLRAISGQGRMLRTLVQVISSDKNALDTAMLEMGRMVAESAMLIEREVSDEPIQSAVFFFELPEPTQFAHAQMGIPLIHA